MKPFAATRFFPGAILWIYFALAVAVCLAAITSASFWIDEACTGIIAREATLAEAWRQMLLIHGSEMQLPLYVLWVWAFAKIAGAGELALRAANAFWFVAGLLAFVLPLEKSKMRPAIFFAAAASPFVWYYLNEARPYAMQTGAGLFLFGAIFHWSQNPSAPVRSERLRLYGFMAMLVLLCGSSLLGMILALCPLLLLAILVPKNRLLEFAKTFLPAGILTMALLFLTGIYYLWTLHVGARASDVGGTGVKNILFAGYELLGFAGLGPGRLQIRDGGMMAFRPFALRLFFYAALVLIVLATALRFFWRRLGARKFFVVMLAPGLPAGIIFVAGSLLHFRVLGRHLAALLPVIFILLGAGLTLIWRRGALGKFLALTFCALYLMSSLSIRLAVRHEKDDYRDAANFAKTALANGRAVWWNADLNAAAYYHLPLTTQLPTKSGEALLLLNPWENLIVAAGWPDVVITSRPDVFDNGGALAKFLAQNVFWVKTNLPAFIVWESPNERME